ncbi:MAG TPA: hypothetical protein VGS97_03235 [Actinocrinis sp.]|uniref:hypothetical protein n=1 Tax=Actinocrinis sp. TaxID=1920516 RepID=UPI002DDD4194|nr:hypothetical protein [Actinocrinis sp.]HEV2343080.1 hypothetical protein [Actinocrinis sp.]
MAQRPPRPARFALTALAGAALALTAAAAPAAARAHGAALPAGGTITPIASTVPANGDVNPYGMAVVPASTGALYQGDVLISNFNAASNLQGTGTTIVQVSPGGQVSTFAQIDAAHLPGACPGGIGLTTGLVALRSGWVIVGSLPTSDGTAATAKAGCLLVLDSHGTVRETLSGYGVNGPWDMTALDFGSFADLFVTNVLNGTVAANGATVNAGTVLRLGLSIPYDQAPQLVADTVIGSGFGEHTDPAALVVGPTGVGLGADGTLYVADSVGNRIAAISNASSRATSAGTGRTVTSGGALNTPLGLAVAPGGDILTVNAGNGFLVATTPYGTQAQSVQLDSSGSPAGAGALFGLAPVSNGDVYFVDDATNTLNLLH